VMILLKLFKRLVWVRVKTCWKQSKGAALDWVGHKFADRLAC
jgi:hypothetical protein